MNKLLSLSVLATTLLLSSCSNAPQEEPLAKVIDRGLKASTEQALLMAKELEQQDGRLPKSIKDGKLKPATAIGGAAVSSPVNSGICMKTILLPN